MEISAIERLLNQLVTREIGVFDYVKAIRVADVLALGKSYQAKMRFVHNTFEERDLINCNRTLYVKKLAVQRYIFNEKKVVQLEAENQVLRDKLTELQQKMCSDCKSQFSLF